MEKVIFLDFDGVLATSRYNTQLSEKVQPWTDGFGTLFDPVCVDNMKLIIETTCADIVVTSTWKMKLGLDGIQTMWSERQLPGKVVGVTPDIDVVCRGNEIEAWLAEREKNICYAIIDDVFVVDEWTGLDEGTARSVIEYLNGLNKG